MRYLSPVPPIHQCMYTYYHNTTTYTIQASNVLCVYLKETGSHHVVFAFLCDCGGHTNLGNCVRHQKIKFPWQNHLGYQRHVHMSKPRTSHWTCFLSLSLSLEIVPDSIGTYVPMYIGGLLNVAHNAPSRPGPGRHFCSEERLWEFG